MSSMSDRAIQEAIKSKELFIDPINFDNIQPGSIDLTLGSTIDVFRPTKAIDLGDIQKEELDSFTQKAVDITNGYDLQPGQFVKGHSKEIIKLPSYINGEILNRNSLVSIGLNAALSQYINPGFKGHKIIVIYNMSNQVIRIKSGIRICQLVLFKMDGDSIRSYEHRHDLSEMSNYIDELEASIKVDDNKHIDTSLADFMNKRIDEIAQGKA